MTLKFSGCRAIVKIHVPAKFHHGRCSGSWVIHSALDFGQLWTLNISGTRYELVHTVAHKNSRVDTSSASVWLLERECLENTLRRTIVQSEISASSQIAMRRLASRAQNRVATLSGLRGQGTVAEVPRVVAGHWTLPFAVNVTSFGHVSACNAQTSGTNVRSPNSPFLLYGFLRATAGTAKRVLAIEILSVRGSVCPSVCLSDPVPIQAQVR